MTSKRNLLKRKIAFINNDFKNDLNFVPWVEVYSPSSTEELVVHKKKVSEVHTWIQQAFLPKKIVQDSSVLLLTGPPGVGKTATVHAICKSLNVEIFTWSNSYQNNKNQATDEILKQKSWTAISETQAVAFNRFLLQSAKYSLDWNYRKIIVIEEFPNAFLKDPVSFHTILRKYAISYQCPAIFIVSDNVQGENLLNNLFPKDLQSVLRINNVSFNPIAPTMLLKVLTRINNSSKVQTAYQQLNKAELVSIASDSKGDIRNAINSMQFLSMTKFKKPCSNKDTKAIQKHYTSERDSHIFLFHALGKILYCKRNPDLKCEKDMLSNKLKHFKKDPLICQPEEVYGRTYISAETFSLFLQENYLSFVEDISNTSECSSWLSEADFMSSFWNSQESMKDYTASLATRGLMFNLTPSAGNKKWKPFHKPQFYEYNTKHKQLLKALEHSFKGVSLSLKELQIDFAPFISKIGSKDLNSAQYTLLKEVGEWKTLARDGAKLLDEKDCFNADSEDAEFTSAQVHNTTTQEISDALSEEEIVIEEYDF